MPLNSAGSTEAIGAADAARGTGFGEVPWTGCVGERTGSPGRGGVWAFTKPSATVVRTARLKVVRRVMPHILPVGRSPAARRACRAEAAEQRRREVRGEARGAVFLKAKPDAHAHLVDVIRITGVHCGGDRVARGDRLVAISEIDRQG